MDLCGDDHRNTNVRFDEFDPLVKQQTTVSYSDSGDPGSSPGVVLQMVSSFFTFLYFSLIKLYDFKTHTFISNATDTFISGFAMRIHFNMN